jgi:hypothetical protein
MNEYYWDKFYESNVKPQIDNKGEAYIEWLISKNYLVKQLNYLRSKYDLVVTYFEKEGRTDLYCVFIKPNNL